MADQFYLQDSRSYVGDGLTFHGKEHRGYYTDLDKCHLYTQEQACGHRDTDIPWPKDYIDARAHHGVDCQLMDEQANQAMLVPGCRVYVQVCGDWNGNDVYWVGAKSRGEVTENLDLAAEMEFEGASFMFADQAQSGQRKLWACADIDSIRRRLVHRHRVSIKDALRGTGIKLIKPKKPREMMFNCHGCGRFISDRQRFQHDCLNCGADNRP
ncbi:hypothetical protein [Pseudomonas abietaniphila]|uniref:Uncharacterized protein n=1 Tax=Pseudomonas abietaniphila TaxID=89065 RepID=A0A1G8TFJ8_9PSED|nr:hypothetical protein [Pseudomonas abietaniphila]SDJ40288.1 hypothetical protein SAMN05216605_12864 [Pseudomonas abietaniphila]